MVTTVDRRGRTVVPAEIRRRFNIKVHSKLEWVDKGRVLTVIPIGFAQSSQTKCKIK